MQHSSSDKNFEAENSDNFKSRVKEKTSFIDLLYSNANKVVKTANKTRQLATNSRPELMVKKYLFKDCDHDDKPKSKTKNLVICHGFFVRSVMKIKHTLRYAVYANTTFMKSTLESHRRILLSIFLFLCLTKCLKLCFGWNGGYNNTTAYN